MGSPAPCPKLCPNRSGAPDCALFRGREFEKPSGAGRRPGGTSAARAAILPTVRSVDYRHQHIDMVTRGAPSSSRSNDPWPSHLGVWHSYRYFDLSKGRVDSTCSRPMQRPLNRPGHHTLSLESLLAHVDRLRANVLALEREQTRLLFWLFGHASA